MGMEEEAHSCDYLVLLFCGTLGNNDPEYLGSDESEIIILVWQLLDLVENKTGDVHYIYVRPESACDIPEEWSTHTGIFPEKLNTAIHFQEAIQQFEQTLRNELNSKGRTCKFFLCTDGQCHLRQVLHPTAMRQNIILPEFFHSFFDLRKEFRNYLASVDGHITVDPENPNSSILPVKQMLQYLNVTVRSTYDTLGVDHVMRMSTVVQVLLTEKHGHRFLYPETISSRLDTGPCEHAQYDEDCVVRARGLPWQASDHDIAKFFRGLNIRRGGVALVLNPQGRRNGEALVQFCSPEHRDLALLRHKHHMANRYIEIDFFGPDIPVANGERGVLIVRFPDGKSSGDAFVLFDCEEMAHIALGKHKQTLGKRYIEIFKSTAAEVQQVLSQHMSTPMLPHTMASMHLPFAGHPQQTQLAHQLHQAQLQGQAQVITPPGSIRNCIRLRGMPYSATVEDIAQFLGDLSFGILANGIHMVLNQQGRPSGDAFIQMTSVESAALAALDVSKGGCHKKHMRERYVEVFQCSGDEMNVVLMGGSLNRNGVQPPPGMGIVVPEQAPVQQRPPAASPMPAAAYTFPSGAQTALMIHPSQVPLEILSSQHQLLAPLAGRHLIAQPTLMPYAYLPTPPVSPSVSVSASTMPGLAASPALAHHLALAPHAAHPYGIQVRMQGVPYNAAGGGVTDILTLLKAQQPNIGLPPLTATGCQSPMSEEKSNPAMGGSAGTGQSADWTCIA